MDFYDATFICTYKQSDDDVTEDLYRSQFLQGFMLDTFNDEEITKKTDKLFKHTEKYFLDIFQEMRSGNTKFSHMLMIMGDNLTNSNLFRVFFIYDTFDLFHRCICDIVNNNEINSQHYEMFKNEVLIKNNQ